MAMNRLRSFVLHKLEARRTVAAQVDDAVDAPEQQKNVRRVGSRRVARRIGVCLAATSSTGNLPPVVSSQDEEVNDSASTEPKTAGVDVKPKTSSKKLKQSLKKACQYACVGAMQSAPGVLLHPTEPNLATGHRSDWSPWNESATWTPNAHPIL